MSANAGTPASETFSAYDQLPAAIRSALREFPINISSEHALALLASGRSEAEILAFIHTYRAKFSPFNPENKAKGLG